MESGSKGQAPSLGLDDLMRAMLPADMPMHPDHPMQQVVELEVVATAHIGDPCPDTGAEDDFELLAEDVVFSDGEELVRKADAMRVIKQLQADNLALRLAAETSAADANDAERKLQQRHEAHRKTWRQTEQLAGLVSEVVSALPLRRDWLDPVLEARMKAAISLHRADSEPQAATAFAGIKIVEDATVPAGCVRVVSTPHAARDDFYDFYAPGSGNRARRRMQALGVDRWVPVPVDSEGGHCD